MSRRSLTLFAGLLLLLVKAQAQQAPAMPSAAQECPDAVAWKGEYRNHSYGFAITIPAHLEGYWNSARCVQKEAEGCVCMSDHGRIIPLTPPPHEPERHIEAYAGHAVDLDEPTLALETTNRLAAIRARSRGNRVEVRRRDRIKLAGIEAERVVARYYDAKLSGWFIEDFIEALWDGVEYSLYLRTDEGSYEHDRAVFESVVKSFVLTGEQGR